VSVLWNLYDLDNNFFSKKEMTNEYQCCTNEGNPESRICLKEKEIVVTIMGGLWCCFN
jgi:hypothetical protein